MSLSVSLKRCVFDAFTVLVLSASHAANPPTVYTLVATDITTNSATLRATVNPNGSPTFAWFVWSDWLSPNQVSPPQGMGNGTTAIALEFALTNLGPTKSYTFVGVATNEFGAANGTNCNFLTLGWPLLGTLGPTDPTDSGATLNGMIIPNGFPTTAWFDYGLTTNYDRRTPDIMPGSGTALLQVSNVVSEFPQLTTVHYRLVGSNVWGMRQGDDASFITLGPAGTALRLDRLTSAVRLPTIDVAGVSNVTLEAWVASGGVSGPVIVMHSRDWGLPVWSLAFNVYQALQFSIWTTTSSSTLASTFVMDGYNGGLWHHIAATYDGTSMAIYHNGRLLAKQPKTGTLSWHATDHLIGTNFSGERFNGLIDEVRIWNRTRTQAELDQGRFQRLTGTEPGLIGYWRFDEGSGGIAGDSSPYAQTGTVLGTPRWEFSGVPLGFPYVQTTAATLTGLATATLNGAINPSGFGTIGWFEWGTTTNYGNVSGNADVGAGWRPVPISRLSSELLADTTYYFRAAARNTNAVILGRDQTFVLGTKDKALHFDGVNNYVEGPPLDLSGTNQLTIEAWVKPEQVGPGNIYDVVRQETPATTVPTAPPPADWLLRFYGASVEFWINAGPPRYSFQSLSAPIDPTQFNDGLWHHLAATYDGTNKHIYHNGLEIAAGTQSGNLTNSGTRLAIGSRSEQAGEFFKGAIDEVRIWQVARSQADIIRDMNRPLSGSEPGLVAYFPFREGTGEATADAGPRGISDTMMNGPVWIVSDALARPFCVALPVTNLSNVSATLHAAVDPESTDSVIWFQWGLTTNYGNATVPSPAGSGTSVLYMTQLISDLVPGTDYHYRCVLSNATDLVFSLDVPFRALGPRVQTLPPVAVSATSMTLNGWIDTYGLPTKYWFEWGTTGSYGSTTPVRDASTWTYWPVNSDTVTNLAIGQVYHYRVMATNIGGLATGADAIFTPFLSNTLASCCDVTDGSVTWGDYNRDGALDLLLVTGPGTNSATTLFTNDTVAWHAVPPSDIQAHWGQASAGLPDVEGGSASWGDYDNDGQLDLLVASGISVYGWSWNEPFCGISRQDSGMFTNAVIFFPTLRQGAAAWGDYDNDGFLDAVVAGLTDTSATNLLFHNNGDGTFSPVDAGLPPVFNCSVAWGDYDNDGQLDLLIAGDTGAGCITRIYRNDHGVFTDIGAGLIGVASGSVAWGDFDGDGWPDVLIAGTTGTPTGAVCKICRNNHDGTFADIRADLPGVYYGSAVWGDYDNDGQLDLLLTGIGGAFGPTRIYRGNGGGKFSDIAAGLPTTSLGLAAWGDYDGDGKLDVALIGSQSGLGATVFRNSLSIPSVQPGAPAAPDGLASSVLHNSVTLSWNPATDPHTPSPGLTYNLRVGTTPGGGQIVAPESDPLTGQRRVPQMGNAQQCLHHWLTNLAIGTYHWSVQAVNQSFVGSSWSPEQTFSISSGPPIAVTLSASNVLCCSARLNGMARPGALPTLAWFDWGTDSASLSNVTPPIALTPGVLPQTVLQTVELSPRTTYFFRFAASNSAALVRGTIESFATEGPAPEVATFGVSNVSYTTALVMGAWGASSPATEVFIEWGASPAYGQVAPAAVLHPLPAVALDGVDDLVAVGWGLFPLVTNTFSMELRARPAAARAPGAWGVGGQRYAIFPDQGSLTYGNPVHAGAGLSVGTNGVTVFEASDNYMPAVATYDFYSTNWMHFAVVYDSHEPHLYIDGVHVRTGSVSDRIVHPSADLGGNTNLGYGQYQGEIQEVRIWGTPLDAGTIQAWMNRPLTPEHLAYSQLLAYWPLDEGGGTTAGDRGPMKHDGQLLNGAGWGSGSLSADRLFGMAPTNLSPGTTYHFRATARNAGGVCYGTDQTFTTLPLPRVLGAAPQTGGKWLLRFDGIPGANYVVEVSTNLLTWTARASLTAGPDGSFTFLDDSASAPIRFYRLKVP